MTIFATVTAKSHHVSKCQKTSADFYSTFSWEIHKRHGLLIIIHVALLQQSERAANDILEAFRNRKHHADQESGASETVLDSIKGAMSFRRSSAHPRHTSESKQHLPTLARKHQSSFGSSAAIGWPVSVAVAFKVVFKACLACKLVVLLRLRSSNWELGIVGHHPGPTEKWLEDCEFCREFKQNSSDFWINLDHLLHWMTSPCQVMKFLLRDFAKALLSTCRPAGSRCSPHFDGDSSRQIPNFQIQTILKYHQLLLTYPMIPPYHHCSLVQSPL